MAELTELPELDLSGLDLSDFGTYVRKLTPNGVQDYKLPLSKLFASSGDLTVRTKDIMRTLEPDAEDIVCRCLGGETRFDNQGGFYVTVKANDQDNDGDRIRPNKFEGFVWYKWL